MHNAWHWNLFSEGKHSECASLAWLFVATRNIKLYEINVINGNNRTDRWIRKRTGIPRETPRSLAILFLFWKVQLKHLHLTEKRITLSNGLIFLILSTKCTEEGQKEPK